MKIQTFSIVAGTRACNARCPFCISRMTGFKELPKGGKINLVNFEKAVSFAKMGGASTVLLTGKGEPTLYPTEISKYLRLLRRHDFPFIELQTNALELGWLAERLVRSPRFYRKEHRLHINEEHLRLWHTFGLNTIAISLVGIHQDQNASVYHPDYPRDLGLTVAYLKGLGFTVRFCLMMQEGFVDDHKKLWEVIDFCRTNGVDQLTARPIRQPKGFKKDGYSNYVRKHGMTPGNISTLYEYVNYQGTLLLDLAHGAKVYDIGGQNVCMSDCLTTSTDENIRSLIFYSNGRLTYDWQHKGAVLLGGKGE